MKKISKFIMINLCCFIFININLYSNKNDIKTTNNLYIKEQEKNISLKFELESTKYKITHKIKGKLLPEKNKIEITNFYEDENFQPIKKETFVEEVPIEKITDKFIKTKKDDNGEYYYILIDEKIVQYKDSEGDLNYNLNYLELD